MRRFRSLPAAVLASVLPLCAGMSDDFQNPPLEARPRVYWLWLHTHLSKDRITYDLEQMKKTGIGGLLHWDPGPGPSRYGTRAEPLPAGPGWMSPEWREHLLHTFKEADRLGLEVSLALTPGANCGGPWVKPEASAQKVVWGVTNVIGPKRIDEVLPLPDGVPRGPDGKPLHYRDLGVFAAEPYRVGHTRSTPEISQIFPVSDLDNIAIGDPWTNITDRMDSSGRLTWDVPPGVYRIMRVGYTTTGQFADYFHGADNGYYADHMRRESVELSFNTMLDKLFGSGPLPRSLKYVHCDSYEVYGSDWTPAVLDEFRRRRGYDPTPFLPTLEGSNIRSRAITARFRADLDRTRSELFTEHHYQRLLDMAHSRGIGFHSESGGPRVIALDALAALGRNDIPMGEFWLEARTHRVTEDERMYVKGAASAAHIYGKRYAAMEAFTSVGRHWEEDPWSLKASADLAFLNGANRLFIHTFTNSPGEFGKPGIEYFAGTHFNPNLTWWRHARAWTDYLARCQMLLSEGLFVADVLYYYGDQPPAYVPRRHLDPSLGRGYDYDVVNAEVLLNRVSVRDGRLVLPDGMSYRVLVLPERKSMQPEVLRKIGELVKAGATVVGPPPTQASGLEGYPARDAEVRALATQIWPRVIQGRTLRDVLAEAGVAPDFETSAPFETIHRRTAEAEIYYVVNRSAQRHQADCTFRTAGKAPELWEPDTGARRPQAVWRAEHGRTTLPLNLPPRGSVFVVFRGAPPAVHAVSADTEVLAAVAGGVTVRAWRAGEYTVRGSGGQTARIRMEAPPEPSAIAGPWTVRFAPEWGGPAESRFDTLVSWTERQEDGIRYYSGTATYETTFDAPEGWDETALDLGGVANLARVKLNGTDLGVLWKPPFHVADIGKLLRPRGNRLEIEVTNLWGNRMIGDQLLPEGKRYTRTNMYRFTAQSPLQLSGLLGPVRLVAARLRTARWARVPATPARKPAVPAPDPGPAGTGR